MLFITDSFDLKGDLRLLGLRHILQQAHVIVPVFFRQHKIINIESIAGIGHQVSRQDIFRSGDVLKNTGFLSLLPDHIEHDEVMDLLTGTGLFASDGRRGEVDRFVKCTASSQVTRA